MTLAFTINWRRGLGGYEKDNKIQAYVMTYTVKEEIYFTSRSITRENI